MNRDTIDYGIDLGTTNSSVAVLDGTTTEVIKDNEGQEIVPSAVWLDRKGRIYVGRPAKERAEDDPENAVCEFKLQMGGTYRYRFGRDGRELSPEELSAEVLKQLKENVKKRKGEDLRAAVVTVPAAFELPQCEATQRAAQLAGIEQCLLLQEPVAAALAHGFQSANNDEFWMVYDFGGGTFDAALIQLRDGEIQVVNHAGDNHLGGKLIDWAIVEQLLIPHLQKKYRVPDLRRGDVRWRSTIAKLKQVAERAKILLSQDNTGDIFIDNLGGDATGRTMEIDYELSRADLEKLAEPYIVRTIEISRRVLSEKDLHAQDVAKVILVGGPTLMPYIRERLADPKTGLGCALDFSVDPLTIVCEGAAVFSGSRRLKVSPAEVQQGGYILRLEYPTQGPEEDFDVVGTVVGRGEQSAAGSRVEFINTDYRSGWRSGKVEVQENGFFQTQLMAEKECRNIYRIELTDASGALCMVEPEQISYTIGAGVSGQPLTNSMGVALANNDVAWFFDKGSTLPLRRRHVLRTAVDLQRGESDRLVRIPVVEGQYARADRNSLVGHLEISASDIHRDLPAGSEVEVTIEIDESRNVRTGAYLPLLDRDFEKVLLLQYDAARREGSTLSREAEREKGRLQALRAKTGSAETARAQATLERVAAEDLIGQIDSALAASATDPEAADLCEKRLRDLKVLLDEAETDLEWPTAVGDAETALTQTREMINRFGDAAARDEMSMRERELREAIASGNPDLLRQCVDAFNDLQARVLVEQPGLWMALLENLKGQKGQMRDQARAETLIKQADNALQNNNLPLAQGAVRELISLLPQREREKAAAAFGSGVL